MDLENFYVTPCFSHDYHLMLVEYIQPQNTKSVSTMREKETDRKTFFFKKKFPQHSSVGEPEQLCLKQMVRRVKTTFFTISM
jgi:hypothetical protein